MYGCLKYFYLCAKEKKRTLDMSKLLTIWNYIRHHKYMITLLVFLVVIGFWMKTV